MNRQACRALLLSFVSAAAGAAEPSAAPAAASELRALCPGIDAALQEALAPAWFRVERAGAVRVRMLLDDGRVADAAITDGPRFHERLVKHALRGLQCSGSDGARREVAFDLRFVEREVPAPGAFAQRAP